MSSSSAADLYVRGKVFPSTYRPPFPRPCDRHQPRSPCSPRRETPSTRRIAWSVSSALTIILSERSWSEVPKRSDSGRASTVQLQSGSTACIDRHPGQWPALACLDIASGRATRYCVVPIPAGPQRPERRCHRRPPPCFPGCRSLQGLTTESQCLPPWKGLDGLEIATCGRVSRFKRDAAALRARRRRRLVGLVLKEV